MKNISAWAIRHPLPPVVLFVVLLLHGHRGVHPPADHARSRHLLPAGQRHHLAAGRGAARRSRRRSCRRSRAPSPASATSTTSPPGRPKARPTSSIEFQIGTPIDRAVADVRDAVSKVRVQLPQGIQEPMVQRVDVDGGAIVYYAVSTTRVTEEELSWFVDNTITKRLLGVPGVAQVNRGGGVNREIRVDLDPARMQALGITAVEVNEQLRTLNLDSARRPRAGRRRRAVDPRARRRAHGGRARRHADHALRRALRAALATSPTCATASARSAPSRASTAARRPPSAWSRPRAPPTSRVYNGVQAELAKIRKENPAGAR